MAYDPSILHEKRSNEYGTASLQNLTIEMVGDEERSAMSSLISLSNHITRGISASVAGYIINISYELPYYITAALYVIAILLFAWIFKSEKHNNKFQYKVKMPS